MIYFIKRKDIFRKIDTCGFILYENKSPFFSEQITKRIEKLFLNKVWMKLLQSWKNKNIYNIPQTYCRISNLISVVLL